MCYDYVQYPADRHLLFTFANSAVFHFLQFNVTLNGYWSRKTVGGPSIYRSDSMAHRGGRHLRSTASRLAVWRRSRSLGAERVCTELHRLLFSLLRLHLPLKPPNTP